jgi:HlyD family secretion protein
LADTRSKIGELGADDPVQRRKAMERARSESRARIAEVLNEEQRARYQTMSAGGRGRGSVTSGRVWLIDHATGSPKSIAIRVGLTDGTHTELASGDLQEGAEVIVGIAPDSAKSQSARQQQKSGPRFGF